MRIRLFRAWTPWSTVCDLDRAGRAEHAGRAAPVARRCPADPGGRIDVGAGPTATKLRQVGFAPRFSGLPGAIAVAPAGFSGYRRAGSPAGRPCRSSDTSLSPHGRDNLIVRTRAACRRASPRWALVREANVTRWRGSGKQELAAVGDEYPGTIVASPAARRIQGRVPGRQAGLVPTRPSAVLHAGPPVAAIVRPPCPGWASQRPSGDQASVPRRDGPVPASG